jgi:anti-anti-sigma factor
MVEGIHFTSSVELVGDGKAILRLNGEIDLATRPLLEEAMQLVADGTYEVIIIDGSEITFMDSTGWHAFREGKRLIHGQGTELILVASEPMRQILELLAPLPLFAARVDSMDEAMALVDARSDVSAHD